MLYRRLATYGMLLLATAACSLRNPFDFTPKTQSLPVVPTATPPVLGFLKKFQPRVTFRRHHELAWQNAEAGIRFFALDAIQTHAQARAVLELVNGSSLELDEDTQVILDPSSLGLKPNRDRAVVRSGRLTGQTRSELWLLTSAALIQMRSKPNQAASAVISLREKKRLTVELKSGEGYVMKRKAETPQAKVSAPPASARKIALLPAQPLVLESEETIAETPPEQAWVSEDEWDALPVLSEEKPNEAPTPIPLANPSPSVRSPAAKPPVELVLTSPANYAKTRASRIQLRGRLSARGSSVKINGKPAKIGSDLTFSHDLRLSEGANVVLIQHVQPSGESSYRQWVIIKE